MAQRTEPVAGQGSPTATFGVFAGFVEGTLIWTSTGLVPINEIKPGDEVLAHPQHKDEQYYKRVVNTVMRVDEVIWHLSYYDPRESDMGYLYGARDHPFWVKNAGWVPLNEIKAGQNLEFQDGMEAVVCLRDTVFRTAEENVGFVSTIDSDECLGFRVDFDDRCKNISTKEEFRHQFMQRSDPFLRRRVFNLEVEDCHMYYVGAGGLRVHSAG